MKVLSTKEEWIFRLIIKNVKVSYRSVHDPSNPSEAYFIDVMLSGIPKDRYDADFVLKCIGTIQNKSDELITKILEENPFMEIKEIETELIKQLNDFYFK